MQALQSKRLQKNVQCAAVQHRIMPKKHGFMHAMLQRCDAGQANARISGPVPSHNGTARVRSCRPRPRVQPY